VEQPSNWQPGSRIEDSALSKETSFEGNPYVESYAPTGFDSDAIPFEAEKVSSLDAFRFAWQDPNLWSNLLIGSVILLIPGVGQIVLMGWVVEIRQRLARSHPNPIPNLNFADFGHYLTRGLFPFLTVFGVTSIGSIFLVPAMIVFVAVRALVVLSDTFETAFVIGFIGGGLFFGFIIGAQVIMNLVTSAVDIRLELTEDITRTLSMVETKDLLKRTWRTIVWTHITFNLVSWGVSLLGTLVLCIGAIPVTVLMMCAQGHLRAQLYDCYLARGGRPVTIKEPQILPSEAVQYQARY